MLCNEARKGEAVETVWKKKDFHAKSRLKSLVNNNQPNKLTVLTVSGIEIK
jgi:hypothetical protein